MIRFAAVFLGAGLGGVARYLVNLGIARTYSGVFPLATFLVNVTGCFLAGVAMTLLSERTPTPSDNWRLLLVVGVLGGFTTFSTFGYETYRAIREGYAATAILNAGASVVLGLAAVWLGCVTVRR